MNLDDVITFVEKPSSELYSLKVKSGPYTGVIYTYGKVQVRENKKQDNANNWSRWIYWQRINKGNSKTKSKEGITNREFRI